MKEDGVPLNQQDDSTKRTEEGSTVARGPRSQQLGTAFRFNLFGSHLIPSLSLIPYQDNFTPSLKISSNIIRIREQGEKGVRVEMTDRAFERADREISSPFRHLSKTLWTARQNPKMILGSHPTGRRKTE